MLGYHWVCRCWTTAIAKCWRCQSTALPPDSTCSRILLIRCPSIPLCFRVQVLDDSYRKALALPVDRFATSFSLGEHTIMPVVQELLMPDAPSIAARLHKLNVYGPGGFFKTHKVSCLMSDTAGYQAAARWFA